MKIAVTGASGFIGSHLVRHLSAEGHEVLAVGREATAPEGLQKYAAYYPWDITTTSTDVPDLDAVIHAAAMVDFSGNRRAMMQANVTGTQNVLRWSKNSSHFVFVSSSSVYPTTTDGKMKEESLAGIQKPGSLYGQTKLAAEQEVLAETGMRKITILRPHGVYGPGDRHLLPTLARQMHDNTMNIVGSGQNQFSITHIGNFCSAVSAALHIERTTAGIFNIADFESLPLQEIIDRVFLSLGKKISFRHIPILLGQALGVSADLLVKISGGHYVPLISRDVVNRFSHPWVVSLDRARQELGYQPTHTLADGCRDIAVWVESIGGIETFRSRQSINSWQGKIISY